MRFVVDECAGSKLARWLRSQGHDIHSIFDKNRGLPDDRVLSLAHAENRILITADKDFGELIFRDWLPHHGVVLLRLDDERSVVKISVLRKVLDQLGEKITDHFVVASESQVRMASHSQQS